MPDDVTPAKKSDISGRTDWNDSAARHLLSRLAQVAQATASAVIITDTDGRMVWVNEGFTRITGYAMDEVIGLVPGRLLQGPDTDRAEVARIGTALGSRQSVASELVNYTKAGRRYWIGMKIEPLFTASGEFEGFMAIESDITVRHEERRSLRQLTRRFNMATRAGRVGLFERDTNGHVVWWSDVSWEIFGQDPATFKLSNETWLDLVHPDDRERMREETRSAARNLSVNWLYRIVRNDGEVRYIRSTGAAADPQDDTASRIVGIAMDVTERVQAEERERALQSQLRESSRQAGMAEIATGVLHNVGNLLNSLGIANTTASGGLKTLRVDQLEKATSLLSSNRANLAAFLTEDERGRHLPDYLSALSAQITLNSQAIRAELDTTEHLLRHLGDIVSAQQELAGVGGRRESIHLSELLETALLVHASDLAQVDVIRDYGDMPAIMTDRHKLLQIMVNLIGNARDALKSGQSGICRIVVKLAIDGDHAIVSIEDSGIGMTEEVLSRLWKFGFTTKAKGHGFGLHNSANAAHEIGATLTAHSDGIGHGSRFVLRLPIADPEPILSGAAA